jgi:hypothetical protein
MVRASLDHPLIRRWLPGTAISRFFQLWEERERFYDALDRLPQTLCHLDYFRRNLFARETEGGDYCTVAVDWAFAGRGAIGEELVSLIIGSCGVFEVDLDRYSKLERIVFEGYLKGLDDAGWRGDPRQVRLGYAAASLRWRFCDLWRVVPTILDESQHRATEKAFGLSMGEIQDHFAAVGELVDPLTDEALKLMQVSD